MPTEQEEIQRLETHAASLRGWLKFARRAFVLELAGTPKAGKSTSVEAIRHFFSRNGFRVHVLAERAAVCPIPMKGHLFFNAWCMTSMLAEMLANVETETDILLVDRGLFDALVWLTMQEERGELTADEAGKFAGFILLDRWTSLTDLAVVMNVDPEEAMARENSQRIATRPGSIMNNSTLKSISESVNVTVDRYQGNFKKVINYKSSGGVKKSNIELIDKILGCFENFLDPEILVISKSKVKNIDGLKIGNFSAEEVAKIERFISENGKFVKRSTAEGDDNVVQIVSCAVIVHKNKVFRFERKERDPKSDLYGKSTLWQGAHVPRQLQKSLSEMIKNAGSDRLNESLFLGNNFELVPAGFCWVEDERHLGVVFRVNIENELSAVDLRKKEYRRSRGFDLSGQLVEWTEIQQDLPSYNFEPWSVAMIQDYKNLLGLKDRV